MIPAETLSLTASDGHRFDAGLYRAASDTAPVLIFLSALGTPSRAYRGFAAALAGEDIHVCTPDWRGIRLLGLPSRVTGTVVGHFPGQRPGFGGREARGVTKDWVHVAHTGRPNSRQGTCSVNCRFASTNNGPGATPRPAVSTSTIFPGPDTRSCWRRESPPGFGPIDFSKALNPHPERTAPP